MIWRLLALLSIAAALVAAILFSQYRDEVNKVSGILEADEIRVGSQVGGRVAEDPSPVREGQLVTKGQTLVQLEPFDLLERQREAEATLRMRQEDLKRMESGFRAEEIAQSKSRYEQLVAEYNKLKDGPRKQEIEVARAQLDVAQSRLTLADQNHARIRGMYEKAAVTAADMDEAGEQLAAATAMVQLRKQELELLLIGTRQEDLDQSRARVQEAMEAWQLTQNGYRPEEIAAAQAACDAADHAWKGVGERARELSIVSPLDAVVEAMELQPGDLVPPSTPVITLLNGRNIWVRAYIPQTYLELKLGDKLPVTIDSYPGEEFEGVVQFISRQAEFTPSNVQTLEERSKLVFRIKVQLENSAARLRPGMSADVWLPKRDHDE